MPGRTNSTSRIICCKVEGVSAIVTTRCQDLRPTGPYTHIALRESPRPKPRVRAVTGGHPSGNRLLRSSRPAGFYVQSVAVPVAEWNDRQGPKFTRRTSGAKPLDDTQVSSSWTSVSYLEPKIRSATAVWGQLSERR